MARPKRKRTEIDPTLEAAVALTTRLFFDLSEQNRVLKLVELVETIAENLSVGGNLLTESAELQNLVGCARQYAANQVSRLHDRGYGFATEAGLLGFFLGQLFESVRHQPARRRGFNKRAGESYYTPADLAYYMAASLFTAQELDSKDFTVLDPCAGFGSLLIASLDYLSARRIGAGKSDERLKLLERNIFAVEIDALTLRVCRACLAVVCQVKISQLPELNFKEGDALSATISPSPFIIANPPWSVKSSYRMFVQRIHTLLTEEGRAAVLTPAAIYSESGAFALRKLLLNQSRWISLEGFINEDLAFAAHPFYKYALSVFAKVDDRLEQSKPQVKVRFALKAADDLLADQGWLKYSNAFIERSGGGKCLFLEACDEQQLVFLIESEEKHCRLFELHADSQPQMERGLHMKKKSAAADSIWCCRFQRDFDVTLDKSLFIAGEAALAQGFSFDGTGRLTRDDETLLPLIEGKMIEQFKVRFSEQFPAQYYVRPDHFSVKGARIGFVSVSSATNSRSMIAALLPDYPTVNSAPTIVVTGQDPFTWAQILTAVLNSFCFDYFLRTRLSGNNLNYFLLDHSLVPKIVVASRFDNLALDDVQLLSSIAELSATTEVSVNSRPLLEALVAKLYGLSAHQFGQILHGCVNYDDPPRASGFQRVDKDLSFTSRLPYLAYQSFLALAGQSFTRC